MKKKLTIQNYLKMKIPSLRRNSVLLLVQNKNEPFLLKIQPGDGTNMDEEDVEYSGYVLYNTFKVGGCGLGIDGELEFENMDGGEILYSKNESNDEILSSVLSMMNIKEPLVLLFSERN